MHLLDDSHAGTVAEMANATEVEPEHGERQTLRREGLGRGDADFWSGVQIDAAVGLLSDGAADDVANRERRVTFAFHFALHGECVGRCASLRDVEEHRFAFDRRIAVERYAGIFLVYRFAGEFFDQILADEGRVPTRAAGRQQQPVYLAQLLRRKIEAAKYR